MFIRMVTECLGTEFWPISSGPIHITPQGKLVSRVASLTQRLSCPFPLQMPSASNELQIIPVGASIFAAPGFMSRRLLGTSRGGFPRLGRVETLCSGDGAKRPIGYVSPVDATQTSGPQLSSWQLVWCANYTVVCLQCGTPLWASLIAAAYHVRPPVFLRGAQVLRAACADNAIADCNVVSLRPSCLGKALKSPLCLAFIACVLVCLILPLGQPDQTPAGLRLPSVLWAAHLITQSHCRYDVYTTSPRTALSLCEDDGLHLSKRMDWSQVICTSTGIRDLAVGSRDLHHGQGWLAHCLSCLLGSCLPVSISCRLAMVGCPSYAFHYAVSRSNCGAFAITIWNSRLPEAYYVSAIAESVRWVCHLVEMVKLFSLSAMSSRSAAGYISHRRVPAAPKHQTRDGTLIPSFRVCRVVSSSFASQGTKRCSIQLLECP
ncbi:hypothetical protein BD289DRAFT_188170 [Coniella lustricola]|uniref:Uncharacterized protein n=1 Tax=Coniella lustricola TaxID=2025994 RepID=A0A2T2ZSY6_9PEZI|nr:hypothetical protein BD289DRAFT_188170 [Coniella lustricola]